MTLGLTYPHIEKIPDQSARLRRVPRVRVAQIAMDYLAHGWSADEIRRQHPYLTLGEIHAALGYYYDHQDEIDADIAAEWREVCGASGHNSPFYLRMRAKGIL